MESLSPAWNIPRVSGHPETHRKACRKTKTKPEPGQGDDSVGDGAARSGVSSTPRNDGGMGGGHTDGQGDGMGDGDGTPTPESCPLTLWCVLWYTHSHHHITGTK